MKLVVGLGNPGDEYTNTRHNIGFKVIDNYAKSKNLSIDKQKFNGNYVKFNEYGVDVILLKPLSYMNLSGEVVSKFASYFHISPSDILIISDDLDMPTGKIKLKESGSSGGHNGLKNIALHLGTYDFKRLKIGISKEKSIDVKDYVLGKLSKEELNIIDGILDTTNCIIDAFLKLDFKKVMSKYNDRRGI